MKSGLLTALYIAAVWVLIVTLAISVPIYCRPFYYGQIEGLGLTYESGRTRAQIKGAYDEVLDYLTLPRKEFGTGVFPHSEEGAAHFADCRALFSLNLCLLLLSLVAVTALNFLNSRGRIALWRPFGTSPAVISAAIILGILIPIGIAAVFDFTSAFYSFHDLFFSGKENWIFNSVKDPIINIFPLEFFINCALLIAAVLIIISVGIILFNILRLRSKKR